MSVFLHNSDPTGGRVQMKRLNYKRAAAFLMGCLLAVNTGLGGFFRPDRRHCQPCIHGEIGHGQCQRHAQCQKRPGDDLFSGGEAVPGSRGDGDWRGQCLGRSAVVSDPFYRIRRSADHWLRVQRIHTVSGVLFQRLRFRGASEQRGISGEL